MYLKVYRKALQVNISFKNILGVNKLLNAKTQSHAAWINAGHAGIRFISRFLSINL